jgi:hypothetical protein
MIERNTVQNHKAMKDESSKENKGDQKYITCTHVEKEWGKDFAGTNEPIALCTPPWHVLREALFGIVQSIKDDEGLSDAKDNQNNAHYSTVPPADIAYVVVVSAAARVKNTNPRPRRRSMLSTSIRSKYEEAAVVVSSSTATSLNSTTDTSDNVTVTDQSEKPRYKLVIDDDDCDNYHSEEDYDHRILDTQTNQYCHSIAKTKNEVMSSSSSSSSSSPSLSQPTASSIAETTRPKFRLCYD